MNKQNMNYKSISCINRPAPKSKKPAIIFQRGAVFTLSPRGQVSGKGQVPFSRAVYFPNRPLQCKLIQTAELLQQAKTV